MAKKQKHKKNKSIIICLIVLAIAIPLMIWASFALIGNNSEEPDDTQEPTSSVAVEEDKPNVELFVMSHCPYGTQVEKGLIPVMETLGDKADIEIKFVYYAMHGKKELDEQLNQYCIQKHFPDEYVEYLSCFLETGDTQSCLDKVGINQEILNTCIAETDEEYNITADYNDKSTWISGRFPKFSVHLKENQEYGVSGSPTLVIDGKVVRTGRDSASLLSAVCDAFEEKPEECNTKLSSQTPSPGFGFDGSGSSGGGCGV
jgi:hypothetical protein